MSENKALRRILGKGWRTSKFVLFTYYYHSNYVKENEIDKALAHTGRLNTEHFSLKTSLFGRFGHRWDDNIKMNLKSWKNRKQGIRMRTGFHCLRIRSNCRLF
jgi:hypothetical protein